jgi:hypothetical protein
MKKYDIYCGLFWMAMAIFVIAMALKFGLGTLRYPAPGLFPLLVGLLLLCLSLLLIAMSVRAKKQATHFKEFPSISKKVVFNCGVLFCYSIFLESLGYVIGTALLLLYLFKFPGARTWKFSILITVIVVGFTYYFFGVLLQAQLPGGFLKLG